MKVYFINRFSLCQPKLNLNDSPLYICTGLFCNCSCVMTQRKHFEGCHGNAPNIIITSRIFVMKMVVKNISEMISHFKIQ